LILTDGSRERYAISLSLSRASEPPYRTTSTAFDHDSISDRYGDARSNAEIIQSRERGNFISAMIISM
jgi:hypothetical protein